MQDKHLRLKRGSSSRMPELVDGEIVFTKDNNKIHIKNDTNTTSFIDEKAILDAINKIELTPGEQGKSIEFKWNGTQLGVRVEGDTNYIYTNLKGEKGDAGTNGADGLNGLNGTNGLNGKSIKFEWKGTQLGIKLESDASYVYSDLGYKMPHGTTAQRPSQVAVPYLFYDTTLKKPIWWTGEKWTDAVGQPV